MNGAQIICAPQGAKMRNTKQTDQIVVFKDKEYEIAKLSTKVMNKSVSLNSIMIGSEGYIAVCRGYRIHNGRSGKPILYSRFIDMNDAIEFAEWFRQVYNDYLEIWDDYPTANIVRWCRYTVKDGLLIDRMIDILGKKDDITGIDIRAAFLAARKEVENEHYSQDAYQSTNSGLLS